MFESARFPFSMGSDNHSGVHPKVMTALAEANRGSAHSYGMDEVSDLALDEFQRVFGADVEPFYVFNGTAANVVALRALLKPFESVICSSQSHLHVDECGALEAVHGAKLWPIPSDDGRFSDEEVLPLLERQGDQHHSQPKVVSLTLPTELGVVPELTELKQWRRFCDQHRLFLHWDGARLANAAVHLNLSLKELVEAGRPDAVSFGGTKNGLMGAECVLFFNRQLASDVKYLRKQSMQLPSKTRFLAAQFYAYLESDLWKEIARTSLHGARGLADHLLQDFPEIEIVFPVHSNALFVQLPEAWIKPLRDRFFFYIWDRPRRIARWMVSFDWTEDRLQEILNTLKEVKQKWPA